MRFRSIHHSAPRPAVFAGEQNDDRLLVDEAAGLALLADAGGPSYGGYYLPVALDEALALLRSRAVDPEVELATALREVNAWLHGHAAALTARMPRSGLDAYLEASRAIARERLHRSVQGLVHFGAAITALRLGPAGLEVAQVGSSRAYLLADGAARLLLPDHLLRTVCPDLGPDHSQARVCTRLLGIRPEVEVDTVRVPVVPGDRVLLCSDGVWTAGAALDGLLAARRGDDAGLVRALAALAEVTHDHATAAVLEVVARGEL